MATQMMFNPVFGRYILLKRIAKGGMAEIFRAMSYGAEGFKKLVVIKRILPELCQDHQFVDMFINEAKIVANLNHPNIVQIYDFGNTDGLLYHSMEYVHGKNMAEIIQAMDGRDPAETIRPACYMVLETLNGLEQAHRQTDSLAQPLHIIHRDMSPSNIIISYDGEVKIADFGIAKAAQTTIHTVGGVVKGKYRYLSPEQARGVTLDQRTDLFSLGICFYEMLTMSNMYADVSGLLALEKVREAEFEKPRKRNPSIPKKLEAVLLKALSPDRDQRYPDAAAFRDDLVKFMGASKMHLSRSWLAAFMKDLFGKTIEAERAQMASEDRLAEELRPGAGALAASESASAAAVKTMLIDIGADQTDIDQGTDDAGQDEEDDTMRMNLEQLRDRARQRGISLDEDLDPEVTQEELPGAAKTGRPAADGAQPGQEAIADLSLDEDEEEESTMQVEGLGSLLAEEPAASDARLTPRVLPKREHTAQLPRKNPAEQPQRSAGVPPPSAVVEAGRQGGPPQPGRPAGEPAAADPSRTVIKGALLHGPPDRIDQVAAQAAGQDATRQRSPWLYVVLGFLGALAGFGIFALIFKSGCGT